jgi:hypothetical protein
MTERALNECEETYTECKVFRVQPLTGHRGRRGWSFGNKTQIRHVQNVVAFLACPMNVGREFEPLLHFGEEATEEGAACGMSFLALVAFRSQCGHRPAPSRSVGSRPSGRRELAFGRLHPELLSASRSDCLCTPSDRRGGTIISGRL